MPDLDPYSYGDASDADRLRYLEQQYAEAMAAVRVSTPEKTVERQRLGELRLAIDHLEKRIARASRMHTVYSKHARAV